MSYRFRSLTAPGRFRRLTATKGFPRPLGQALAALAALILLGAGCERTTKSPSAATAPPPTPAPPFSADSALAHIRTQLAFGPRVPNSAAHSRCADWLVARFKAVGPHVVVVEQTAQVPGKRGKLPLRNIIVRVYPERAERVMLSAHYDARIVADQETDAAAQRQPVPAANDGASGVAVLLELARHLGPPSSATDPGIGVDIALWDLEDQGQTDLAENFCLGSAHWAANPHQRNYRARFGIVLDMVGARGATFPQEEYSLQYAANRVQQVWRTAHRLGYGAYFPFQKSSAIFDDHVPLNQTAGIPTLDIIHRDLTDEAFFAHWHKRSDDISQIDKGTLLAVGQTVLQVVYDEGAPFRRQSARPDSAGRAASDSVK